MSDEAHLPNTAAAPRRGADIVRTSPASEPRWDGRFRRRLAWPADIGHPRVSRSA